MTDQVELGSKGFADPTRAIRLRDVIRNIAEEEVGKLTADQQIARVVSANFSNLTAQVWIPGDPEPITVSMFESLIPGVQGDMSMWQNSTQESTRGAGSLVVIDKVNGKLFITQVLSGGQFSWNLGAAGLVYKVHNGLHTAESDAPDLWSQMPPVSGNYGLSVSLFAPSNGVACMIGPFVAFGNGNFNPGTIKVTVTRSEDTSVYESTVDPSQIARDPVDTGATKWMRMIPQSKGTYWRDQAPALDIGIRSTSFQGGKNEIWLRLHDTASDADFSYIHVESYGPLITYGDTTTGRIRIQDVEGADIDTTEAFDGILGFHDSFFLFRGRQREAGKTGPLIPAGATEDDPVLHSGNWNSGARTMHQQLDKMWTCDGHMVWNGLRVKWNTNLIFNGIGRSTDTLPEGILSVPMPANSVPIPMIPSGFIDGVTYPTSAGINADGIALAEGCTLYYGIPPGMLNNNSYFPTGYAANNFVNWHTKTWMFFIVNDNPSLEEYPGFSIPEWAIPICSRKASTYTHEFVCFSPNVEVVDTTKFQVASATSSLTTIAYNTETVLQTISNFKFKAGSAYRIKAKTGWTISNPGTVNTTAASNTVINFRLRKGTAAGGTDIGEFFRVPIATSLGQYHHFNGETYVVNSGADTTGSLVLTGQLLWTNGAVPANTPTFNVYGSTASRRWLEIEYAGPSARFPQANPY